MVTIEYNGMYGFWFYRREVCHTEPEDEFLGEWIMNADGNEYVAMIKVA